MRSKEAGMSDNKSFTSQLRIILAIASKDLIDALKNRTILSIVLGVFFVVLASRAMSLVIKLQQTQTAVIAGPGASTFIEMVGENEDFRLGEVDSAGALQEVLATSAVPYLGIVLPDDWETILANHEDLGATGYVQHWLSRREVLELISNFERHLSQALGANVEIDGEDNIVYPTMEFSGSPFMISIGLVVAVMMIGLVLVPMLMLEEREQKTIDVLLISPASYTHIVLGKALAGITYSLAAVGVLVVINANYIVQWDLIAVSILLGTLLAVLVGLLLGTVFDQATTMNMWMGIIVLPLLAPIFLRQFNPGTLPGWLEAILPWIPSAALDELFRLSFVQGSHPELVVADLGLLAAGVIVMVIINTWRLRKLAI
jgi:ABC-2 type transport system permease protein